MLSKLKEQYYKVFSVKEIEDSFVLQLLFYVITASFFVTFYGWINNAAVSIKTYIDGNNVCPPYFLNCGGYYFLQGLPYGYTQGMFYVGLYLLLLLGVWAAINKKWVIAHSIILICLLWKVLFSFVFTYGLIGNFDYYDMALAFVWLFLQQKEFFAKVTFVWLYFLASTIKIHDGWILGNYFNSLYTGAPFFGFSNLPIVTNFVTFMQIVGAWFLFSKNRYLYWFAFSYFLAFHIYSGIIVNYRYITVSIPALLVLFGVGRMFLQPTNLDWKILKINKRTVFGYLFLLMLLGGQMVAIFIPGDQKKTLEGNYYGLFMFEAAHQCYSNATMHFKNSTTTKILFQDNNMANNRCDPYRYFYTLKTVCDKGYLDGKTIDRISWKFDHSINGYKYERIVDTDNVCMFDYKSFSHNDWIKIGNDVPGYDRAEVLDFPVYKMGYLGELDGIYEPTKPLENKGFLDFMTKFYWFIWTIILLVVVLAIIYISFIRQR